MKGCFSKASVGSIIMGLYHVDDATGNGGTIEDGISDTQGSENLMESGTELTPGQGVVMRQHPLVYLVDAEKDSSASLSGRFKSSHTHHVCSGLNPPFRLASEPF